jgi:hypothetical protein
MRKRIPVSTIINFGGLKALAIDLPTAVASSKKNALFVA